MQHHRVTVAASGAEAKQLIDRKPTFDAIVCDLTMPEVSGVELYEWLLAQHPALATKVIFMSGGVHTLRAATLLATVPNHHLTKPFDVARMKAIVALVVHGK